MVEVFPIDPSSANNSRERADILSNGKCRSVKVWWHGNC